MPNKTRQAIDFVAFVVTLTIGSVAIAVLYDIFTHM